MGPVHNTKRHKIIFALNILVFSFVVIELLVEIFVDDYFFPSAELIYYSWFALGLISMSYLLYVVLSLKTLVEIHHLKQPGFASRSELKRGALLLALIFPIAVVFFLQCTFPYTYVSIWGKEKMQEMTISALNSNGDKKFCIRGVYIAEVPFFANEICDIEPEKLHKLKKGSKIIVTGKGNWMGIIPADFKLKPPS